MRGQDWRTLDDEALGRLLLERWLYRGMLLVVMFLAAVLITWLGTRGLQGLADQLMVAVLVALAVTAAVVSFVMRQRDLQMHAELRARRRGRAGPP